MTTAAQNDPRLSALVRQLGEDNAIAIAAYVNGTIDTRVPEIVSELFGVNREELSGLAQRVQELSARHGDQPEVRVAAAEVAQVTRDHNIAAADPSEEAAVADAARTQRAAEVVDRAERQLDGVPALSGNQPEESAAPAPASSNGDERGARHEAILAVDYDGERPPSRIDNIVERLDDVERCLDEHSGVIASAFAQARASVNGANTLVRVGIIGLVTFGVAFLVCCLVVMVSPLEWDWLNIIGLSAVTAGIAALIAFLRADFGVETLSYAEAATIVAADRSRTQAVRPTAPVPSRRLTLMDDGEAEEAAVAARRPSASASAAAGATVR